MLNRSSLVGRSVYLFGLAAAAATAQNPTFSLEVVAVNSMPLKTPVSHIQAAPGDVLTVEVFLRDWSPEGEVLRAYQLGVDLNDFAEGLEGSIKPVNYDDTSAQGEKNPENAFVNPDDPRFVHLNLKTIPIADSVNYRWASVLLDPDEAPLCAQDGKKFYAATLRLQVSADAFGPYKLRLDEEPGACSLRDPLNKSITPLDYEHLAIEVVEGTSVLRVRSSDPPSDAIDARCGPMSGGGASIGPNTITLGFSNEPKDLMPSDFVVEDGSESPPNILSATADGTDVTVVLDRHFSIGTWTTITHGTSQTSARIGCLPGDVDNDGKVHAGDLAVLLEALNSGRQPPLYKADINRDGKFDVTDALRLIDLFTAPDIYRRQLGS